MPHVLGLEQKMCVRLWNGDFSVLVQLQTSFAETKKRQDESKKLQAKRRTSQRHMRSMPLADLWDKNAGKAKKNENGVGVSVLFLQNGRKSYI